MLPVDLLRRISNFLVVKDAHCFEKAVGKKIYGKKYYATQLYRQDYQKAYDMEDRKVYIDTCRVSDVVFSLVHAYPKKQFVIRHNEDISTIAANIKAYEAVRNREHNILRRRLEMVGF